MINLGRCLVYLLGRHDRVAVSGIGTFGKTRKPAYFDAAGQCFHPSLDTFSFDADSGTGEGAGLIVDYISAQRRISRSMAQASYRKTIAAALTELDTEGKLLLDGFGELTQEKERLVFAPLNQDPAFRAGPVQELPILPVETVELDVEEESSQRRGGFWKVAAILVITIGVLFAAGALFRPDLIRDLRVYLSSTLESPAEPRQQPDDTISFGATTTAIDTSDIADKLKVAEESELVVTEEEVETEAEVTGPVVTYEIIVASFTTMEQAHQFVDEMKAENIDLRAIDSRRPGNRKKVSFSSYPTKEEAYRALPEVQRTLEPTAWVDRIVR